MLTVGQLIARLQDFDPDDGVYAYEGERTGIGILHVGNGKAAWIDAPWKTPGAAPASSRTLDE